jgi:hypothetical protein
MRPRRVNRLRAVRPPRARRRPLARRFTARYPGRCARAGPLVPVLAARRRGFSSGRSVRRAGSRHRCRDGRRTATRRTRQRTALHCSGRLQKPGACRFDHVLEHRVEPNVGVVPCPRRARPGRSTPRESGCLSPSSVRRSSQRSSFSFASPHSGRRTGTDRMRGSRPQPLRQRAAQCPGPARGGGRSRPARPSLPRSPFWVRHCTVRLHLCGSRARGMGADGRSARLAVGRPR